MENNNPFVIILLSLLFTLVILSILEITYRVKQKKRIERKEIDQVRRDRGW